MLVINEFLAIRVLRGDAPPDLPDDDLLLPTSRHWRLLPALQGGRRGRLSRLLGPLPEAEREALRYPHPEVLQILDPRPLFDEAAALAARFNGTGWLIAETLAAGRRHGRVLWFGEADNVGGFLRMAADELGMEIHLTGA